MKKNQYIGIFLVAILLAWWFRYDTHCTSGYCVSYDRLTGEWIAPSEMVKYD